MVDPQLLEILVCPETQQRVRPAGPEILEKINREIEAGRLTNRSGARIQQSISEGLIREDGAVLYPVVEGIPVMLLDEAIRLDTLS